MFGRWKRFQKTWKKPSLYRFWCWNFKKGGKFFSSFHIPQGRHSIHWPQHWGETFEDSLASRRNSPATLTDFDHTIPTQCVLYNPSIHPSINQHEAMLLGTGKGSIYIYIYHPPWKNRGIIYHSYNFISPTYTFQALEPHHCSHRSSTCQEPCLGLFWGRVRWHPKWENRKILIWTGWPCEHTGV